MLHRVKKENDLHAGKWNGLGGKLENNESPLECAHREVKEECGLHTHALDFAGHLFFPGFDKEGNNWSVFVFRSHHFSGNQLTDSPEGELHWINENELLKLNLWEGDKYFLPLLLSKELFLGKFTYENKKLIQHELCKF